MEGYDGRDRFAATVLGVFRMSIGGNGIP